MVAILGFSKEQITEAVRAMYGAVAAAPSDPFHFPVGREAARAVGYSDAELEAVPADALASFAGVGCPFRAGVIREGDAVLDVGAGAGTDSFIASRRVGPEGRVYALDITEAMLEKLVASARAAGIGNIETIHADAEQIPLPDNSVDVVTSNGALNLVPDKRRVFAEIFRVLRPEGRAQVADVVIARPVPLGGRSDPELWTECVVGASVDEDYIAQFGEAGFSDVEVLREFDYFAASPSAETRRIAGTLGARTMELAMRRPAEAAAPAAIRRFGRRLRPARIAREIGGRGLWGGLAAIAAVLACYGPLAILGLLSLLGVGLVLDEGVWAVTVAVAAVLAAVATGLNLPRHRQRWPLLLALVAAGVIAYVMFVSYDVVLEATAFAALLAAVGLDLYLVYRAECLPKRSESVGGRRPPGQVQEVR
jgi:arsenite methyltransferase